MRKIVQNDKQDRVRHSGNFFGESKLAGKFGKNGKKLESRPQERNSGNLGSAKWQVRAVTVGFFRGVKVGL